MLSAVMETATEPADDPVAMIDPATDFVSVRQSLDCEPQLDVDPDMLPAD